MEAVDDDDDEAGSGMADDSGTESTADDKEEYETVRHPTLRH